MKEKKELREVPFVHSGAAIAGSIRNDESALQVNRPFCHLNAISKSQFVPEIVCQWCSGGSSGGLSPPP